MRKGNDYTVYDNDTLTPGYKAKIEHTVYSGSESRNRRHTEKLSTP